MELVKSNSVSKIECNSLKQKTTLPLPLGQSRNRAVKSKLPQALKSIKSDENTERKKEDFKPPSPNPTPKRKKWCYAPNIALSGNGLNSSKA